MSRAGGGRPTTTAISRVLTVPTLRGAGLFTGKPGARAEMELSWLFDGQPETMAGTAEVGERSIALTLRFTAILPSGVRLLMEQRIELAAVPQPFGGLQWLFHCPQRWHLVRALYRPGTSRFWGSRHFHGLAYASTRLGFRDRAFQQSTKLRTALDPAFECYADPLPDRPKGMWASTYARHLGRIEAAETRIDARMPASMARLLAQWGSR